MHELENILGQTAIIDSILSINKNVDNRIFLLEGESGCGKSYLSQILKQRWIENNASNLALIFKGDNSYSERFYYPFLTCKFIKNDIFFKKKEKIQALEEFSKDIPFVGNTFSFVANALAKKANKIKYESSILLNQAELDIFFKLQFYARKGKLLLVADNFHWWDDQSISFLKFLCSDEARNIYSFLKNSIILIIITSNQEIFSYKATKDFINNFIKEKFVLNSIKLEKYEFVLRKFGLKKKISHNIMSILFAQTGGHLELIKNLVDYINNNNSQDFKILKEVDIYKEKILEERLKLYGVTGEQIVDLLTKASIIGLSFDYKELECITKKKESIIKNIISKSNELSITKHDEGKIFFRHEIFKTFFLCKLNNKKSQYSKRFAECLRILRPGDYNSRAKYLFDAGDIENSVVYYIAGYFKILRDGKSNQESKIKIEILSNNYGLNEYFELMIKAYGLFSKKNYDDAIKILKEIEDFYPKLLLAEKDYLLSLCYSKNIDVSKRIEAKNLLSIWINDKIKTIEGEIWIRIISTLVILNIHLNDHSEARKMERILSLFLFERKKYDPHANDAINIIRRKANAIYSANISVQKTKKSIDYFKTVDDFGEIKNPLQYYMALSNHAGNLLLCGEFKEATYFSKEALNILNRSEDMEFPRPEIPINNFIISGFLSGELSANEGIDLYDKIIEKNIYCDYADRVLMLNNQAILFIYSDDLKKAIAIFNKVLSYLKKRKNEDNFYEYYIKINSLILNYFLNNKKNLKKNLNTLLKKIPCLPDSDKELLIYRHKFFEKELLSREFKSIGEWDKFLIKNNSSGFGSEWRFWGKSFLLSDLQFWSES